MANVAIYYQKYEEQDTEQAVFKVNKLIKRLETLHVIKGVFLDNYNESSELLELLNSSLSDLDYLFLNKPLENEFDSQLFDQLSKTEKFEIKYFNEV
ncbi:hypothetical protein AC622_07005 [Bacillus sp. FJAT-27916]|uniref:hypothetical protein n=1 Tax=Bacillus sp. FJAT-27916 TaxID=1679169 RepID=UPI000670DA9C|nr:hypothetical protein [Bacillus sp. FJAT-27916]KMY44030.1 hypothetical protein AC622_07005 [Bacillus sp. FJAT-27916]